MNHLSPSDESRVSFTASASARGDDSAAPSIAFSNSSARLRERFPRAALVSAMALGILGGIALLHGAAPGTARAAAGNDLDGFYQDCEAGDAVACNNLGVTYQHGYSVTPDAKIALHAFERACEGGSPDGCGNLGALYERGEGTAQNLTEAARLYEQACNGGAALGCSNLGALYARGRGVARSATEARRLFALACDTGSAAGCSNLMQSAAP